MISLAFCYSGRTGTVQLASCGSSFSPVSFSAAGSTGLPLSSRVASSLLLLQQQRLPTLIY